jgi:hypothetical protein
MLPSLEVKLVPLLTLLVLLAGAVVAEQLRLLILEMKTMTIMMTKKKKKIEMVEGDPRRTR